MKYICKICGQVIDTNDICPFCGSDSSKIEPYETEEEKVYRCLNCGHELDSNEKCPFCGADSKMIFDISANNTTEDDIPEEVITEESQVEEPHFEYCEGDDCCCNDQDEECECCCSCNEESEAEEECCCCCQNGEEESQECCCNHEDDHECCHTRLTAESFEQEHSEYDECEGDCEHCGNCCSCNEESEADEECECCQDEYEEHECCCGHVHEEEHECCCGHCHDENEYTFDEMVQDLLTVYGYLYKNDYNQAKIFEEYLRNFFREVAIDFENELDVNEAFANLEDNVYFKDIIKQFN